MKTVFTDKIVAIIKQYGKCSLKTIGKYLKDNYSVDVEDNKVQIKNEINQAVRKGILKQTKNSYEIGDPSAPPDYSTWVRGDLMIEARNRGLHGNGRQKEDVIQALNRFDADKNSQIDRFLAGKVELTDGTKLDPLPLLPKDIFHHILNYIHPKQVATLSRVNKNYYAAVSHETLWKHFSNEEWPNKEPKTISWKKFFSHRFERKTYFFKPEKDQIKCFQYEGTSACFYCDTIFDKNYYGVNLNIGTMSSRYVHYGCFMKAHNFKKFPIKYESMDKEEAGSIIKWLRGGMKMIEMPNCLGPKLKGTVTAKVYTKE